MGDKRRKLALQVAERHRIGRESATVERLDRLPTDGMEILPDERQRIISGPVDRMHKRGELEGREHSAAETFRNTHYLSAIDPGPAPSSFGSGGNPNLRMPTPSMWRSQRVATARVEWRRIEAAFRASGIVWGVLKASVIDEIALEQIGHDFFGCRDRREARAAGRAGIRVALGALADHYGI